MLFENPGAASPLNHLGVEVASARTWSPPPDGSPAPASRHTMAEVDPCCHAVQDKVWVDGPDVPLGAWEFYTVLADDPATEQASTGDALTAGPADATPCCAGSAEDA